MTECAQVSTANFLKACFRKRDDTPSNAILLGGDIGEVHDVAAAMRTG